MAVREWQGEIIFLRRIDEGSASKSYGIQVARLAGLPASVVDRARDILKNLESAEYNEYGLPTLAGARAARESADAQMELFSRRARGDEDSVLDQIRRCEPERLSPLDALMRLAEWKGRLGKGST